MLPALQSAGRHYQLLNFARESWFICKNGPNSAIATTRYKNPLEPREQSTRRSSIEMATGDGKITAVVFGASGSVGQAVCRALANLKPYGHIISINRSRKLDWMESLSIKATQVVLSREDFQDLKKIRQVTAKVCKDHGATHAFSSLGIGTKTGSITKEQHRAVDVETNRAFALGCSDSKLVTSMVFLSSVSADPNANENGSGTAGGSRYLRVKGESEEAVKAAGIRNCRIIRPAMIKGSQNTPCILECMEPCCWYACCLFACLPSKFHSIDVDELGVAMGIAGIEEAAESPGNLNIEYDKIVGILSLRSKYIR
eukprot:jgi/Bigna1/90983/estExt_fgenesh1_pg.C_850010